MQIKAIDGTMHEISMDEAKRVYHEMSKHMAARPGTESPMQYHDRAYRNICERAKEHGIHGVEDDEDDMKELMLFAVKHDDADMIGEIIEWFISMHDRKVGA